MEGYFTLFSGSKKGAVKANSNANASESLAGWSAAIPDSGVKWPLGGGFAGRCSSGRVYLLGASSYGQILLK